MASRTGRDHHPTVTKTGSTAKRAVGSLVAGNLLGGIGVASSVAVGALLVERTGGTAVAGLGQAASVLGAALLAVPLAQLAGRRGRRWSLATGYAIALAGALLIIAAAARSELVPLLAGLTLFGAAQAANLQSRYAATDGVPAVRRGQVMSLVVWATTVGTALGPNLSAVGERLGLRIGLPSLVGPYLFSTVSFLTAGLVIALLYPRHPTPTGKTRVARPVGAVAALRWAVGDPRARSGVALVAGGQAVMTSVMVMTPLHMQHNGMSLQAVGLVISLHTLGMYAFSPLFGWLTDRSGAGRTAWLGTGILALAVVVGLVAASSESGTWTAVSLFFLGLGWSGTTIAGSTLVARTSQPELRVSLQGAADAAMNYAGAAAAALAGPVLAAGGFRGVNLVAGAVLALTITVLMASRGERARGSFIRPSTT